MKLAKRNPIYNKGDSVSTCKMIPNTPKKLGLVGVIVHRGFIMVMNIDGISHFPDTEVASEPQNFHFLWFIYR